ncbi:hypothetical protein ACYSNM_12915 [Myroides sp. LJL116]
MATNLTLDEIAYSFKNCTGETAVPLKEYLRDNVLKDRQDNTYIVSDISNFILNDVKILLKKSITNILAADSILLTGSSSWGFVTTYYSNFFSIQALNRLSLNFNLHLKHYYDIKILNYTKGEFHLKRNDGSTGSHQQQFDKFYNNYMVYRNKRSINRSWNLGIYRFKEGIETMLRNEINYSISNYYYDELSCDISTYSKKIREFKKSPITAKLDKPYKLSHSNLELALCRIEMIFYILNYLANKNIYYRSYFNRFVSELKKNIQSKFSNNSNYLVARIIDNCKYSDLGIVDEEVTI